MSLRSRTPFRSYGEQFYLKSYIAIHIQRSVPIKANRFRVLLSQLISSIKCRSSKERPNSKIFIGKFRIFPGVYPCDLIICHNNGEVSKGFAINIT